MPRKELPHAVINLQQNEVGERAWAGGGGSQDTKKTKPQQQQQKKSTSNHGMKLEWPHISELA